MMTTLPDIGALSAPQLTELIGVAQNRLTELREIEAPALLEKCNADARALGFHDLADMVKKTKSGKRGRGRPRLPQNGSADHAQQ